ncbi:hypothetical protein [Ferruginibacter profundus]
MLKYFRKKISQYRYSLFDRSFNELKILAAKKLVYQNNQLERIKELWEVEFNAFSQSGDDGIIQYLISKYQVSNKTFVEFGVENYRESNTRFLLVNNNWAGLVIDGSKRNIDYIKQDPIYIFFELHAFEAFITKDNINDIIGKVFSGNIGLLSVDIDGNDYWILDAITVVSPDILVVEYNAIFGAQRAITVPYDDAFVRTEKHYSNLYWGASINAVVNLASKKGYVFVGCNNTCNNAYFIKKEVFGRFKGIEEKTSKQDYVKYKFRQSRNEQGHLNYLNPLESFEVIKGMPVVNILTGLEEKI